MRILAEGTVFNLRAIAGLHVVTLAWDFANDKAHAFYKDRLLGFAIERAEYDDEGKITEKYWLRGIKRFKDKDEGLAAGSPVPTSEHPVQSFQWGDYTAKPGRDYEYRIVPAVGVVKYLELDEAAATAVRVRTEVEEGKEADDDVVRHDIYFNRGAAGSQAYARRFPNPRPDENDPKSEQMQWLSRGLFEGLTKFISHADGSSYKLRAMLYEFRYPPVGKAFKTAAGTGANIAICYEAQSYKDQNEVMIADIQIKRLCKPQKHRGGIRHNKFIVLVHNEEPVAVWTGSTNISAGGIFGHSNVGHAVWDRGIAQIYLDYWEELAKPDVTASKLKKRNQKVEPTPDIGDLPAQDRIMTFFSPRDTGKESATLNWYAKLLASASRIACMTFAFNFDNAFSNALKDDADSLNFLVFDKSIDKTQEAEVTQRGNTIVAIGSKFEADDVAHVLAEELTGFNHNKYIHDKFLLVDPLGDDPITVTGSANFSVPSQTNNDENMLVIRGDTRVADIYFGEFLRIFDHLYVRYVVSILKSENRLDPEAGYLKVCAKDWLPQHFRPGRKDKRRRYFMLGG